jgi:hypothetical protein
LGNSLYKGNKSVFSPHRNFVGIKRCNILNRFNSIILMAESTYTNLFRDNRQFERKSDKSQAQILSLFKIFHNDLLNAVCKVTEHKVGHIIWRKKRCNSHRCIQCMHSTVQLKIVNLVPITIMT